jgi:hypothetical protein
VRTCFNIYCDESCHLPLDHQPVMVLGALRVPAERTAEVSTRIREIKADHGLPADAELKWGKVSPRWVPLYRNVIDYFFDDDDLTFRAVVAHRANLNHAAFGQTHDEWYYKMYYLLLSNLLETEHEYHVYLDIKDTRGGPKVQNLHEILCTGMYDFREESLRRIQTVRSHEVQAIQLADVLIGAISYSSRRLTTSPAKLALVDRIKARSGKSLDRSTPPREAKFNLFHWSGSRTGLA